VATIALKYTQSNSVCVAFDGQVIGMAAGQQSRIHCTRLACEKAEKWMLQQHPRVLAMPFQEGLKRPERTNAVDQYVSWSRLAPPEQAALRKSLNFDYEPLSSDERSDWIAKFPDLCLSSDAFIPFRDNIDRAAHTGIRYVAHTGGSARDQDVRKAAAEHDIVVVETGLRCFTH
jgi:phosphoribosylaminoimidazolecarboxamide formyltransferase/IMP cyclohydrolase/phosphoribosylaminoimidazolecarboxamide formyltransferase